MSRDPRFDILFEPIRLGPVLAKNRSFQDPYCNGMVRGPTLPCVQSRWKAAGPVVSTEKCEIHPCGDVSSYIEARW